MAAETAWRPPRKQEQSGEKENEEEHTETLQRTTGTAKHGEEGLILIN